MYGLNPDCIGALSSSAGGHLVALMGTRNAREESVGSRFHVVCDWLGPPTFDHASKCCQRRLEQRAGLLIQRRTAVRHSGSGRT